MIARSRRANRASSASAAIQGFPEIPQCVGVRDPIAGTKTAEPHPAQSVLHEELGLLQGQPVQRLENQHPEFENRIDGRPAALAAIAPGNRFRQVCPEYLEIDRNAELLQWIAMARELRKPILNVPKPNLSRHPTPPESATSVNHVSTKSASFRRRPLVVHASIQAEEVEGVTERLWRAQDEGGEEANLDVCCALSAAR